MTQKAAVTSGTLFKATAGLFASVLALQVRERRYVPWTYWSTVVLVSVVGENLDDPEGCGDLRYLVQGLALDLAHPRLPSVMVGSRPDG
jgi:uncharacterized membrane-anchored protein